MNFALVAATFSAGVFCLTGCGKSAETGTAPSKGSAASRPLPDPPCVDNCHPGKLGGRFIITAYGDPKTFNPITENEGTSDEIVRHLFSSLAGFDVPSQEVEPGLAQGWSNSPDGKTWTFYLRKNLRWSDGAPLTARDVTFTWNDVIYNPKIDNVTRDLFVINGKDFTVTKLDDFTVRVVTPEIYAPFLENFGSVPIMPKHILEKSVEDGSFTSAYGANSKPDQIVDSGPYIIQDYKPAQYILLARNPYFFEVDSNRQRLPYFDNIIYTIVPNLNAVSLRFLSGESDADDRIFPYEYDEFKAAAKKGKFDLLEPGISTFTTYLCFNENTNVDKDGQPCVDPVKLKWFRNVKFRQAVSYAINRKAIIQSVYAGRAVPNYGFVTPANKKWYNPNVRKYPYDPAKALELLQEIGIEKRNGDDFLTDSNGNKIAFMFNTNVGNSAREKTVVLIAADLQKLGMDVTPQPIEFNTLVQKLTYTYHYDCILISLGGGGTDPSGSMNVIKSSAFTHQWFPREKTPSTPWEARLDHLMADLNTTLDFARRKKDWDEVQMILSEEVPLVYTVTPEYSAAIRSSVGNVRYTPLTFYQVTWNTDELYFEN
ncbi:MAG: ABC transporter substrate-binding protein [Limisphaerales bacterium]